MRNVIVLDLIVSAKTGSCIQVTLVYFQRNHMRKKKIRNALTFICIHEGLPHQGNIVGSLTSAIPPTSTQLRTITLNNAAFQMKIIYYHVKARESGDGTEAML